MIKYIMEVIQLKTAKISGENWLKREEYVCKNEWPEDCSCQGGTSGIVFSKNGNYETAFFEAFPKEPKTFIRGEGKTVEEAEQNAWEQFQRNIKCINHEFERRRYKNGCGICKHCGLFMSDVFEPDEHCKICGKPTYLARDINSEWYCEEHKKDMPDELIPQWMKDHERIMEKIKEKRRVVACQE
jgi:hypothetical protein